MPGVNYCLTNKFKLLIKLQILSLVILQLLTCWAVAAFRVGRGWDSAHKVSIRAALVPNRGASTNRENPVRDSSWNVLGLLYPAPGVPHFGRRPYQ
eukprot:scaffold190218_cov20-Tisochrysis_lutea.AAC.2